MEYQQAIYSIEYQSVEMKTNNIELSNQSYFICPKTNIARLQSRQNKNVAIAMDSQIARFMGPT